MKRLLISTLFILMIISVTQAQSVITGTVTDVKTGEALIGCNVYLKNTTIGTVTNAEGNYVLQNVPPGTHILIASYLGFEEKGIEIGFKEKETKNIDFKLQYSGGIDLDEVTITVQAKVRLQLSTSNWLPKRLRMWCPKNEFVSCRMQMPQKLLAGCREFPSRGKVERGIK